MKSEGSEIVVCQGPPRCDLMGHKAVEAQLAGCIWCERILIDEDGSETSTGPTTQ